MLGKVKQLVMTYVFGPTRIVGRIVWRYTWGAFKKRLDDPQLVLEDTIGRMEDEVRAAREGVAQSMVDERKLARSVDEARAEAQGWRTKARAFVSAGDDARAREALARHKQAEELATLRAVELERLRERIAQLKAQVDLMGRRFEEAKRMRSRLLMQVKQHARAGGAGGPDPFEELERIEEKISDLEVRAEVERDLAPAAPALPSAADVPLLPASDVDEELEKLRKELGSK